jgi:hypothetical protein
VDHDVQMFAQVMTVIMTSLGALVVIVVGARWLWRKSSSVTPVDAPRMDDRRMERLETAVDAIAFEVERISEAQRFTTQLLAERLPARGDRAEIALAPGAKRVITPH